MNILQAISFANLAFAASNILATFITLILCALGVPAPSMKLWMGTWLSIGASVWMIVFLSLKP